MFFFYYTILASLAAAGAISIPKQANDIAATEISAEDIYRVDEQPCIVNPPRFAEKPILECPDPNESGLNKRRSGNRGGASGGRSGSGSPPKGSLPKPHIDLNFHITGSAPGTKEDRMKSSSTALKPGYLSVLVALLSITVAMVWT